jgi:thymidylate synthase (FAD)
MARVSNPSNQNNTETSARLIKYLIDHKHWSPFEMVNMCVSIETTRSIAAQILRHRSFSFQEFSQRYAEVTIET